MKKLLLLLLLGISVLNYSFAQKVEKKQQPVRLLLGAAFEFGGDDVAEIYFTNGETQSVKAGQGVSVAVGGQFQFPKVDRLLLRATVGYKYVTTQADNAHIRLTRVPLLFTANWMATEKIRLAAGLATHQAIHFKADNIGEDINFKGATGPVFEIAYAGFGLTYTAMNYKDDKDISYSANAIGLSITGVLPKNK